MVVPSLDVDSVSERQNMYYYTRYTTMLLLCLVYVFQRVEWSCFVLFHTVNRIHVSPFKLR